MHVISLNAVTKGPKSCSFFLRCFNLWPSAQHAGHCQMPLTGPAPREGVDSRSPAEVGTIRQRASSCCAVKHTAESQMGSTVKSLHEETDPTASAWEDQKPPKQISRAKGRESGELPGWGYSEPDCRALLQWFYSLLKSLVVPLGISARQYGGHKEHSSSQPPLKQSMAHRYLRLQ